ncbi:serine/threonine protein kinase [Nostoc sp. LEGE 06077]|uniref:serine/threonine-protein kinase n=1 Tax=Nostoc sp. LEGE 06077 TaxID=915325 RepID=UPI0018808178|nr:serine/threonine-protein kinase [Nostoc sp. LEGE 06077]MBE9206030.1 serine/threonine protein kinase [Nostoc sp. LEGE 06077]
MSLCINPFCPNPENPENDNHRFCQSCGSQLLLEDRYRVMRLLSDKTSFGKIYEVYTRNTPKILKVLKEQLNNHPKAVELFQKEANVLSQLNHPGIPKVDGYFQYQTSNGFKLHCLVMEKIDGVNLEEWLQQQSHQPISEKQAIAWLKQLAEILNIVHSQGWFHRDIKPANIMLRNNGQLVLIDFGTARDATHTYLAKLGTGNQITAVFSAGYTATEQACGQAVPQSDFFSLGRTFVYLLTAQYPLRFYNARDDVLNWRSAANVSPKFADSLDNLMARKAADRPQTPEILLQQLQQLEQTTTLKPIHVSRKFPRVITAGTLLLLGGVLSYGLYQLPKLSFLHHNQLEHLQLANTLADHAHYVKTLAITQNGKTLVSGSSDKTIKIWNLADSSLIRTISGHDSGVIAVAISPDNQTLVSSSNDQSIRIWNLESGALIHTLNEHKGAVWSITITPEGQTLVSGSGDKTIKIWHLKTGELIKTLTSHLSSVMSLAISHDGKTLVSGSNDKTIKIWNLATGELIRTIKAHDDAVIALAITPDDQTLVSSSNDKTIKIWNLTTGSLIRTLTGHNAEVFSVSISPDGKTLASGSGDTTIKLWNLNNGSLIRTLTGHTTTVYSVVFSPDSQTLVSGSSDRSIKIWRVK